MSSTTLLATDQQRSVLSTLKANHPPQPIAYMPYGHRLAEGRLLSLFGFNGELPDPLTGHYLLGNGYRAFNPVLMRFNSPDNLSPFKGGGINAYAYCAGDPTNNIDPDGHLTLNLRSVLQVRFKARQATVNLLKRKGTINTYPESPVPILRKLKPGVTEEAAAAARSKMTKLSYLDSFEFHENQQYVNDLRVAKGLSQSSLEAQKDLKLLTYIESDARDISSLWSPSFDKVKLSNAAKGIFDQSTPTGLRPTQAEAYSYAYKLRNIRLPESNHVASAARIRESHFSTTK